MYNNANRNEPSWIGRMLMAVGIGGAALAALCCIAPFLIAGGVSAVGLGFMLNDSILMGLVVVFFGVALLGYFLTRRRRSRA